MIRQLGERTKEWEGYQRQRGRKLKRLRGDKMDGTVGLLQGG